MKFDRCDILHMTKQNTPVKKFLQNYDFLFCMEFKFKYLQGKLIVIILLENRFFIQLKNL